MKRSLLAIASAVGLLCLGGTPAWASPTSTPDVQWTYNFTPNQPFVSGSQGGSVSFTSEPTKSATNTSDVVVTNLKVSSTASADSPESISGSSGAWTVGLKLTDSASGASDNMSFSGQLSGSFSASNSNISDAFTPSTQSYTWKAPNGNQYKVTLKGYTPPGPPSQTNLGSISAYVQVTPGDGTISGGGGGGTTPEPSTLVLSCLGLGFVGLASWRKRRRSLATVLA